MRKIPPGAEASNILVGEVDFLSKPLSAFVRLKQASCFGDLTEVPVPTRFLFILLGPKVSIYFNIYLSLVIFHTLAPVFTETLIKKNTSHNM